MEIQTIPRAMGRMGWRNVCWVGLQSVRVCACICVHSVFALASSPARCVGWGQTIPTATINQFQSPLPACTDLTHFHCALRFVVLISLASAPLPPSAMFARLAASRSVATIAKGMAIGSAFVCADETAHNTEHRTGEYTGIEWIVCGFRCG